MVRVAAIIGPLTEAEQAAKSVGVAALHADTFADVTATVVREARAFGLVEEARPLARSAERAAAEASRIGEIDRKLVRLGHELLPMSTVMIAGRPAQGQNLADLFALFPDRQRTELGATAIRLAALGSAKDAGLLRIMEGAIREVVAMLLDDVVRAVHRVDEDLRASARGSDTLSVIDSAHHGPVKLPALRQGEFETPLGTDRLVGMGHVKPQEVPIDLSDATTGKIRIAGVLDVALAVEVKGRTVARGGIRQLLALQVRGERGYAVIGKQLWLLEYDPRKVLHLLVAPEGKEFAKAAREAEALNKAGFRTRHVAIPVALDNQVFPLARGYLEGAADKGPVVR